MSGYLWMAPGPQPWWRRALRWRPWRRDPFAGWVDIGYTTDAPEGCLLGSEPHWPHGGGSTPEDSWTCPGVPHEAFRQHVERRLHKALHDDRAARLNADPVPESCTCADPHTVDLYHVESRDAVARLCTRCGRSQA